MIKGAVPTEAWMQLSRKRSDGQYGSDEKLVGLKLTLTPDAEMEAVWAELWDELQSELGHEVVATVASGFMPAPEVEEAEEAEPMEVVKFTFEAKKEDKFELGLFENFGDKPGRWATIKFTANREDMWNMIGETIGKDYDISKLPVEYECSYWADWKHGRQKKDSDKRYQDLVALRPR